MNFALATQRFDISPQYEQPQPPGYILYVALGKALDILTHDPQTSYVWISIIATGFAVGMCFYLGTIMFGRTTGFVAAVLLLSGPLFWFYGEVALPHALDMALVLCSVLFLYRAFTGDSWALTFAALSIAIAGGTRPQTLVFLAPLYLFVAWRVGLRYALPATLLLTLCCLLWFIPLVWLSGGLERYRQILADFSLRFDSSTSVFLGAGFAGLSSNADKLIRYTLFGLGLMALPLAYRALLVLRDWRWIIGAPKGQFAALWILPCLVFYLLIMMGQQGLIFVYLPALIIIGALSLVRLARTSRWASVLAAGFIGIAILFNAWLFLLAPEYLAGRTDLKVLNLATIQDSDSHFGNFFRQVRDEFVPSDTVILTANWRHVEYYLPAFKVLHAPLPPDDTVYRFSPTGPQADLPQINLILFDVPSTDWGRTQLFENGSREPVTLTQLALHRGDTLAYSNQGIRVEKYQGQ